MLIVDIIVQQAFALVVLKPKPDAVITNSQSPIVYDYGLLNV